MVRKYKRTYQAELGTKYVPNVRKFEKNGSKHNKSIKFSRSKTSTHDERAAKEEENTMIKHNKIRKRKQSFNKLTQRSKRGQKVMKHEISRLLEKIEKSD